MVSGKQHRLANHAKHRGRSIIITLELRAVAKKSGLLFALSLLLATPTEADERAVEGTIMDNLEQHLAVLRSNDPRLEVTRTENRAAIALLGGKLTGPTDSRELDHAPEAVARRYLTANEVLLGGVPVSSLVYDRVNRGRRGTYHVVFQQKYGNAAVLGGSLSVHYNVDGAVYMLKSGLAYGIDAPDAPTVDSVQAGAAALKHAGVEYKLSEGEKPKLVIAPAELLHVKDGRRYLLCWQVLLSGPGGSEHGQDWTYFVDAANGDVVLRYRTARTGSGVGHYSTGSALNTEATSGTFRLRDTSTSARWEVSAKPVISTYDDSGSISTTLDRYSVDRDDNWDNAGQPSTRSEEQTTEVDIHRFLGYAVDYYYDRFG